MFFVTENNLNSHINTIIYYVISKNKGNVNGHISLIEQ